MRKSTRFVACSCNDRRRDPECESVVHLTVAGRLQLELLFVNIHHQLMVTEYAKGLEFHGQRQFDRVVSALQDHYYDRVTLERKLDEHCFLVEWEELELSEMFQEL